MAAKTAAVKLTTGLTGLPVVKDPHRILRTLYHRIQRAIEKLPESAAYRQNTNKIISQRLQLVESESDVTKLEEKIGMGQIEEVIVQATHELDLARAMADYKGWEPLVAKPSEDQWRWPI